MPTATPPSRVAPSKVIELDRHFYQGTGDVWITHLVLAFVDVDVQVVTRLETAESLILITGATFDRQGTDIDPWRLGHEPLSTDPLDARSMESSAMMASKSSRLPEIPARRKITSPERP